MEVTDICMDKEPDIVVMYLSGSPHEANNTTMDPHHVVQTHEDVNGDLHTNFLGENAEANEYEVKECTSEKAVEISTIDQHENIKEQDIPVAKCETGTIEEQKSESHEVKQDDKKCGVLSKPKTKSASGNGKTKCTVPQPFALATAKRASFGGRPVGTEPDNGIANKTPKMSTSKLLNAMRQNQVASFCEPELFLTFLFSFFLPRIYLYLMCFLKAILFSCWLFLIEKQEDPL